MMRPTDFRPARPVALAAAMLASLLLVACTSTSHRAPVEDRKPPPRSAASAPSPTVAPSPVAAPAAPAADATPAKPPLPGAENAGKPGYYTVQKGDTLIRIGLDNGQPWRDIARWN